MNVLKRILRLIFGNYEIYWIYSNSDNENEVLFPKNIKLSRILDKDELKKCVDADIQNLSPYSGDGSLGFGAWFGDRIVSSCWFWHGERYKVRNFWHLGENDAKLVQVTTAKNFRGRSLATSLITYATEEMKKLGYDRLYARIWVTHRSSIAAFTRAGWNCIAIVIKVFPCNKLFFIKVIVNFRKAPFLQGSFDRLDHMTMNGCKAVY